MSILSTLNLSKKYRIGEVDVLALDTVNLTVNKGEFVTIMGPSGSGKSTLLHLLGGLDKATSGQIFINQNEITGLSEEALARLRLREIGFIFQSYNLLSVLTAEENAALPLIIEGYNVVNLRPKISKLFDILGIGHRLGHKVNQLSGGEQQRVAIARALITDPSIIFADEPTGNLDSIASEEIVELLRKSCDELGQTIVMVSHDPKIAAYSDRIIFIKDGTIVDQEELGSNDFSRHLNDRLQEIEVK